MHSIRRSSFSFSLAFAGRQRKTNNVVGSTYGTYGENYYEFFLRRFNPQEEKINPQEEKVNPQEEKVNLQEEKINLQE